MISWCGGILQDSHRAVRAMGFLPEEGHGVYIARYVVYLNNSGLDNLHHMHIFILFVRF